MRYSRERVCSDLWSGSSQILATPRIISKSRSHTEMILKSGTSGLRQSAGQLISGTTLDIFLKTIRSLLQISFSQVLSVYLFEIITYIWFICVSTGEDKLMDSRLKKKKLEVKIRSAKTSGDI